MTSGSVDETSPPSQGATKPNPFQRIVGVLISPDETFASIARQPDWIVPLLIMLVLSMAGGILIAQRVDFTELAREAMESSPQTAQIPADRLESTIRFTAAIMKVGTYSAPVISIIFLLIVAGVLLLAFRIFGGEGNFVQAFSVTVYAWYPRLIKGLVALVVLLSRKSMSVFDLQNPLLSNLGFLFDPKTHPLQFALGISLDLFSIWSLILLIIGFATISRLTRARSAVIVVSLWIVVTLFSLIGPALQAIRSRS